jgi:hypothetical protein
MYNEQEKKIIEQDPSLIGSRTKVKQMIQETQQDPSCQVFV